MNNNIYKIIYITLVISCLLSATMTYSLGYDTSNEQTFEGIILSIEKKTPSSQVILHVELPDGNEITVYLCPRWYYVKQKVELKINDTIIIIGSTLKVSNKIIAKSIQRDSEIIILRDENGNPIWAGKGKYRK